MLEDALFLLTEQGNDTIKNVRRRLNVTEAPLQLTLLLTTFIAVSDTIWLGRPSLIWFAVIFECMQLSLIWFFLPNLGEGKFMKTHGSKFLICMAWTYIGVSEYVLGFNHLESPACAGILFQHLPTYVVLLAAVSMNEAIVALIGCLILVVPLADTWWRLHDFVIHSGLLLFAAWVKTSLISVLRHCDVTKLVLTEKDMKLGELTKAVMEKDQKNATLTKRYSALQEKYTEMSDVAEQAVSMMRAPRQS
eukprot:TRINITY_DN1301_c0_g2_i2.p1 TRINITY_DN1301_c0_g2~~TRINITY_DN1301_c0_g2_i2.p1  ORF type:complete len:249 (+),score=29.92 TRINITY_DN1301_c0_g2_i2:86-832(+)